MSSLRSAALQFARTTSRRSALTCCGQNTLKQPCHIPLRKMSFSNTDTGSKPADPYKQKNLEDPSLKEKIEDLGAFVDRAKFCMLTTKTADGLLASRAMALAAKVSSLLQYQCKLTVTRSTMVQTSSSTPTQSLARPMTLTPTQRSTLVS